MESRHTDATPLTVSTLIFPPLKVCPEDLQPNGLLLATEDVQKGLAFVRAKREVDADAKRMTHYARRFTKKEIGIPYSLIVFDEQLFAIYRGVKQGGHLGVGGFGYAKIAQNILTGAWVVLKLSAAFKDNDVEYLMLQKFDMAIGRLTRIASDRSEFVRAQRRAHPSYWSLNQENLVMKLASGLPLASYYLEDYELTDAQWLNMIVRVAESYANVASKNVIHGDITLTNVFYDSVSDAATIIDFGAALKERWIIGGATRGLVITRGYDAPELTHVSGKHKYRYTRETDIYALGRTFFYLLRRDEEDRSCMRITDVDIRSKILDFIHSSMCHDNPGKRANIDQVICFFKSLRAPLFGLYPQPIHRIALLPLNEYRQLVKAMDVPVLKVRSDVVTDEVPPTGIGHYLSVIKTAIMGLMDNAPSAALVAAEDEALAQESARKLAATQYENLLAVLKQFDEVAFVDATFADNRDYIRIRKQLALSKVQVSQHCFISGAAPHSLAATIANHLLTNANNSSHKYFFITVNDGAHTLTQDEQSALCVLSLHGDHDIKQISQTMHDYMFNETTREYESVLNSLDQIANRFAATNASHSFIREIEQVKTKIKAAHERKQLTSDVLTDILKILRKRVGQAEFPEDTTRHHYFFTSKSGLAEECSQAVKSVEAQLKSWTLARQ